MSFFWRKTRLNISETAGATAPKFLLKVVLPRDLIVLQLGSARDNPLAKIESQISTSILNNSETVGARKLKFLV